MFLAAACSIWLTMGPALSVFAREYTVGARCPKPAPVGFSCPALVWEVFSTESEDPIAHAEWEPDCSEEVGWEAPFPRRYALTRGDWNIRVTFCGAGLKDGACRPGPRLKVEKKVLSR